MSLDRNDWYGYLLQQMVAECYFESIDDFSPSDELVQLLNNGNNRNINSDRPSGFTRLTDQQASEFLAKFRIVHQWSDNPNRDSNLLPGEPGYLALDGQQILANSGLSATLIKNIDENSPDYGTYTLSIRSSEYAFASDGGDKARDVFGTDIGAIAGTGFALAQLDALERYVEWLRRSNFLPQDQKINITGYSLGAHLGALFTEMHPEQVIHVYAFNGAGRGEWDHAEGELRDILDFYRLVLINPDVAVSSANTTELVELYQKATLDDRIRSVSIYDSYRYRWAVEATVERFGLKGNISFNPITDPGRVNLTNGVSNLITHIYGHAQNGDAEYVANSGVHGPSSAIFIEDQPNIEGVLPWGDQFDFGTTHSLTLLADSLATMRLFERMDRQVSLSTLTDIFAASSAQRASTFFGAFAESEGDSLEKVVSALGDLFNAELAPMNVDRSGGGFANIGDRNVFYENLATIDSLASKGSFHVYSLVGVSPQNLIALARGAEETAYRYALKELNPFAVIDDAGGLYSRFEEGGSNAGELEYFQGDGLEGLNDGWIEDRAALLVLVNDARIHDRTNAIGSLEGTTGETIYSAFDAAGGRLTVMPQGLYLGENRFVTFGADDPDELIGQGGNDRFYGGEGDDLISGVAGDDRLQGDEGADSLYGGDDNDEIYGGNGNDVLEGENGIDLLDGGSGQDHLKGGQDADRLFGGKGDDTLDGGEGNDRLEGGEGFDTYLIRDGEGVDTIVDSDGLGRIAIDGRVIVSPENGFRRIGNVWMSEGASDRYSFYLEPGAGSGNVLVISGLFHGQIRIEDFTDGDLGILLGNVSADVDSLNPAFNFFVITDEYHDGANVTKSVGTDVADNVVLHADYGFFLGLGGNDVLGGIGNAMYGTDAFYGNGGDDLIIGREVEYSEYGMDRLSGGGGADRILGGAGSDQIDGDTVARFLPEGFRIDTLYYRSGVDEELGGYGLLYDPYVPITFEDVVLRFNGGMTGALHWILGTNESTDLDTYFNDYLDGGAGDDHIDGMTGSDQLYGGEGDDVLLGDSQVFQYYLNPESAELRDYFGRFGDDFMDGGDGNDNLSDYVAGNDVFLGGDGDDTLGNEERRPEDINNMAYLADSLSVGDHFNNYLDGGDGDDSLKSVNPYRGSHDVLLGGNGNDILDADGLGVEFRMEGGAGSDIFNMRWGSFTVDGGTGGDTYKLGLWYGNYIELPDDSPYRDLVPVFHFSDWDPNPDNQDILEIGLLVPIENLQIYRSGDDLLFGLNTRKDVITIKNWYRDPSWKIERVTISAVDDSPEPVGATITHWDVAQIESRAIWLGTDGPDLFDGEDSGETINGGDGDDVLIGGGGDDVLIGAGGNDTYRFGKGFGRDIIVGAGPQEGEQDSIELTDELEDSDVEISRREDDLELRIIGTEDRLILRGWFGDLAGGVGHVRFFDGVVWDASKILSLVQSNHAPVAVGAADDQEAMEDTLFMFQMREDLFYDEDAADTLSYAATLASGSELPSWLLFDPVTRTFSGIPLNSDIGSISIRLSATDIAGEQASIEFNLTVENTNDAPTLLMELADQIATDGAPFVFDMPGGVFVDIDANDVLVYAAAMDSGSALPSWLSFDSENRRFLGTPSEDDIGSFVVKVTAADSHGLHASDEFEVIVNPRQNLYLLGEPGNQRLEGQSGDDTLDGGQGADVLVGKLGNDTYMIDSIRDLVVEAENEGIDSILSLVTYTLPENVENLMLTGASNIIGTGNALDNVLRGNPGRNRLRALVGNDLLEGGEGDDRLEGGPGNDVLFGGQDADYLYGESGEDFLSGDAGSDYLYGGLGQDILQGGGEDDDLDDPSGRTLLDGGSGNDILSGRKDPDLIFGGRGDDTVEPGAGQNVIGFNLGDGKDAITRYADARNTISLGGGVVYSDLEFSGPNFDLILKISSTDQITFKDWYRKESYQNTTRLQIIVETMPGYDPAGSDVLLDNKVETFDFAALVAAFDAADRVDNWSLTDALLSAHLSGSDTAAIGGDLAYQYAVNGSLSGIGLAAAQDVLKAPQFGASAQTLRPQQDLQQGQIRLS